MRKQQTTETNDQPGRPPVSRPVRWDLDHEMFQVREGIGQDQMMASLDRQLVRSMAAMHAVIADAGPSAPPRLKVLMEMAYNQIHQAQLLSCQINTGFDPVEIPF